MGGACAVAVGATEVADFSLEPTVAQDRADRVVALGDERGDVVRLDMQTLVVVCPSGRESVEADALAVEPQLVEPERGGIDARARDCLRSGERLAQIWGGSASGERQRAPRSLTERRYFLRREPRRVVERYRLPVGGAGVGCFPTAIRGDDDGRAGRHLEPTAREDTGWTVHVRRLDRDDVLASDESAANIVRRSEVPVAGAADAGAVHVEIELIVG